ncbi:D-glycero-beta-D-manno-heptose-7-phosphate kinase [Rudaeicoccus suwonensis]|uniref:Bifunctional protein HldE n=1 Tax=Rudaeicoccus suwonensis TaxID=657409 RepID=A0A561DVN9_9MICO|nr:D-glycero-beta-D-manno-heptose-7-phosphate kinase [Rudaeicoccus suwonensis]TWE07423.1 D-beta-D-heptose 7-phosphate kinase/D-beta-D-heptose 1-phosphate adenosyltransferase [Rudaeicoccus suwonensis]
MARLAEVLDILGNPRVLVMGDLIVDEYLWGVVDRVSPEAPVPVLRVERAENRPGGAANVAMNLEALGATTLCAGVVGDDTAGQNLTDTLRDHGIDTSAVVIDNTKKTTVKTRCIGGSQQMLRIDNENTRPMQNYCEQFLFESVMQHIETVDLLIVSDYQKGTLTQRLLSAVNSLCRERGVPVLIGPKGKDYSKYRGCTAVMPNLRELALATSMPVTTDAEVCAAGQAILGLVDCDFVVVTRGELGMTLIQPNLAPVQIRGHLREVFDVTGAGDTALATLGVTFATTGVPLVDAVSLANVAGGLSVTSVGAATVSPERLRYNIDGSSEKSPKIVGLDELVLRMRHHSEMHESVVLTNGCFDMFHVGHLETIRYAKSQGDVLVVAINSDSSTTRLKGPRRPIVKQEERSDVIAALEHVDYVVVFDDDTPTRLLNALRPDVLVKGGDYEVDDVVGVEVMAKWGGRVAIAPTRVGASTTQLVARIVDDQT